MAINTYIRSGSGSGQQACVEKKQDTPPGLITYTEPWLDWSFNLTSFTSETFGSEMAANFSASGTPENIHNGTDNTYWTASALSGSWNFADNNFGGNLAINGSSTNNGHEALFTDSGAGTTNMGNFAAISGRIYITRWDSASTALRNIALRFRLSGVNSGNSINISSYVDITLFNTWQSFLIPKEDFGVASSVVNQMVIQTVNLLGGQAPNYYFDDLKVTQGGTEIYKVQPEKDTLLRVNGIQLNMVDAFNNTLADATTPEVIYNQLIGVTKLSNGVTIRKISLDETVLSLGFNDHISLMNFPGVKFSTGGDGTNTWHTYYWPLSEPIFLDRRKDERLEILLSDDLSGLITFKATAQGGTRST